MEPLVYVDRSDIRPGKANELEAAARQLVEHVASNEQRSISYGIYFSADRSSMTVVHVHPDSASLEQLMALIAPVLAPFRDLLQLRSIDVYGSPSSAVLAQLRAKVDLLGGTITSHGRITGVDPDALAHAASSGDAPAVRGPPSHGGSRSARPGPPVPEAAPVWLVRVQSPAGS